ncbi:MAG: hypothetical protein ACI9LM_003813 [Alteromonadaceae bacterium]|jgi:hypothetical protein
MIFLNRVTFLSLAFCSLSVFSKVNQYTDSVGNIDLNIDIPSAYSFDIADISSSDIVSFGNYFTIKNPGIYEISYQLNWATSDATARQIKTYILKNGKEIINGSSAYGYNKDYMRSSTTNNANFYTELAIDDVIELIHVNNNGVSGVALSKASEATIAFQYIEESVSPPLEVNNTPCIDIESQSPGSPTGIYNVDVDSSEGLGGFDVYCNMDTALGGWTLVDTRTNNAPSAHYGATELLDPVNQPNNYLVADKWLSIKENATQLMVTDGDPSNYVIFDLSQINAANCTSLTDDLANTPVFNSEISGCSMTGSDYTYLSNPSMARYFTTVTMYNLSFLPVERSGSYGETGTMNKVYYSPVKIQIYIR